MAVQPSDQWSKLLVSLSVSTSSKPTFSILTNQLVRCGVTSIDNVSLENMVRSLFPLLIGMFPPPPYLIYIKGGVVVGGEVVKADNGEEGGKD